MSKAKGRRGSTPETQSERAERLLVSAALTKLQQGGRPTSQELAALKRFEKQQEEERRWQYYRTVPKKHYREMSGRAARVLIDQATRYGIPIEGPTVDLGKVLRWLHDFLAKHAARLSGSDSDDLLMAGGESSPALERYREERAKIARLDRLEKEGQLLPRGVVHEGQVRIAAVYRSLLEKMERKFGGDARDLLAQALDDAQREIDSLFGDGDDDLPALRPE